MKELRELASKATPGPWKAFVEQNNHGGWRPTTQDIAIGAMGQLIATYSTEYAEYPDDEQNAANAAFIAAANPAQVLKLLDRIEALELLLRAISDTYIEHLDSFGPDLELPREYVFMARSLLKDPA
jgi:hypothetical protein